MSFLSDTLTHAFFFFFKRNNIIGRKIVEYVKNDRPVLEL